MAVKVKKEKLSSFLFLALVALLVFFLSACGSKEKAIEETKEETNTSEAKSTAHIKDSTEAECIDYADAESFEYALNHGVDVTGKIVQFSVLEYHPASGLGNNAWAGEHLNFINERDLKLSEGQIVTARVLSVRTIASGSWVIDYEVVENAVQNESTITADNLAKIGERADIIYSFENGIYIGEKARIEIVDVEIAMPGSEYNKHSNTPLIRFFYDITNTSDQPLAALGVWIDHFEVIQDNNPNFINKLKVGSQEDASYHYLYSTEIKPGGTVRDITTYELDDLTTPITLKAYLKKSNYLGEQVFDVTSLPISTASNGKSKDEASTENPTPTTIPEEEDHAPVEIQTPEVSTSPNDSINNNAGMRPEFKQAMDSYEEFFDEYIEICTEYSNNPSDTALMLKYATFMMQYQETMDKLNSIDTNELSAEEESYYLEVLGRINQKLYNSLGEMS